MMMTMMMAVMTLSHENYKEREMKSEFQENERAGLNAAIGMNDVDVALVWMNLLRGDSKPVQKMLHDTDFFY